MLDTDEQKRMNIALRRRQGQLENIAKGNRKTLSLGKGIGLGGGLGAVWMLCIANPAIGAVVGAIALVNYAAAAMRETEKTGEYRPLLGRKSLSGLAMGLDRQSSMQPPSVTVEDDALYLEDRDLGEWLLLRTAMPQCIQFLSQCPEENRDEALDLAATEAYRTYGYMFRAEPDTRHQMKNEQVGQYAFAAVRQESGHLLGSTASPAYPSNDQNIGINTQLGAIGVPAAAVTDTAPPPKVASTSIPTVATAWDSIIDAPMQSRAFFGGQRTGKSYFAAAATAEIKKRQNTRIFHLNLHSFGEEDSYYWKHAEQSIAVDLSMMDFQQAKVVIQSAVRLVETFYKTPNAILVFDEWTILGATNSRYKDLLAPLLGFVADKITILNSSGQKRAQAIWTISPDFVAATLTQSAKAIKALAMVYVSIAPGRKVIWNGQAIGASLELWSQLNVNYPVAPLPLAGEFECDRIVCINCEWVQLGELPKLEPDSQKLERILESEAIDVPQEESLDRGKVIAFDSSKEVEKPDLPQKEIFALAVELEEWISQHPEVERKDYYARFNAARKSLSRPQFRYLLTLVED